MKLTNNTKNVKIDTNSQFENTFASHVNKLLPELGTSNCQISGTGTNNSIMFSVSDSVCFNDLYKKINTYYNNNKNAVLFKEVKDNKFTYQFYLKNTTQNTTPTKSNNDDLPVWGQALASQFGVKTDSNLQTSGYFYDNKKTISEEIDRIKKLMKK
jgi:hypothetical protein